MSVTMHLMGLQPMIVSSSQPHADLLLSMEAEALLNRTFCPVKIIFVGPSGSFGFYL